MGKKRLYGLEPDQVKRLFDLGTNNGEEADSLESGVQPSPGGEESKEPAPAENLTESLVSSLEQVGQRIGPYKLLSVLGEGGMGTVYLAEQQGSIRRRVALKVIKPGMDSKRVIVRFESERQALALLDHPNIAQVYDAGATPSGRPYFVMEYVRGLTVTEYCDRHKLSIDERLRLFQQVCHAVQHAHQKGIIHRDIKPSNILVSAEADRAIPKIIDFGVAKAMSQPLTERTLFTEDSQLLGTPEYMSPEQAEMINEDIDTRSDVYSLGVLLYVLLAGILPYDSKTFRQGGIEHVRQIIRESDPKTPSTRLKRLGDEANEVAESRQTEVGALARCLHRELEWIPLKAMRKERAERYRSASELSDDIENYLEGNPLIAGPLSAAYQLRKFVRRNRVFVGGIAAVLIVLAVGVVVSTIFAIGQARALAENQLISDFLKNDVLSSASKIKGRDATVFDVLNAAAAKLGDGKFQDQPFTEASVRETLGSIYFKLGDYKASALHREYAYRIYGEEHRRTTGVMNWLAVSYNFVGRYREAEKLWDTLIQQQHDWAKPIMKCNLAVVYARQGRYEDAEQIFLETFETAGWGTEHPMTLLYSWDLAKVYRQQGRYKDAEKLFVKTLKAQRQKYGERGEKDTFNRTMIRCMNELACLYVIQERYTEAETLLTEGIEIGDSQLPGKDHPFTLRHVNGLGVLCTKLKRDEEAEALFNRALRGRKLKLGEDHPYTLETINDLGVLRREQGQHEEAEKLLTEACEGRQVKLGSDHPATLQTKHELAILHMAQSQYDKAEPLLLEAFHGRETKLGPQHPHTVETVKQLISLYESLNMPDKVDEWRAKLPAGEDAGN